jgi:hypothetical protein
VIRPPRSHVFGGVGYAEQEQYHLLESESLFITYPLRLNACAARPYVESYARVNPIGQIERRHAVMQQSLFEPLQMSRKFACTG